MGVGWSGMPGKVRRKVHGRPALSRKPTPCTRQPRQLAGDLQTPQRAQPERLQPMPRMTTAEATVAALAAHGLDTVYALPGIHNDPLFDALFHAADRIRTVHTRHEQGAAYMALGAALATGRPQAYTVVPGPGLLNTGAA